MESSVNVHEQHRKRMKERFLKEGLRGFEDHEVLEMMLYYTIPRNDTNEIAHELLREFGTLSAVLDADIDALNEVPGIGRESALYIKYLVQLCSRYETDKSKKLVRITDSNSAADYLRPYFIGHNEELFIVALLDAAFNVRKVSIIEEGGKESVFVNANRIVKEVVNNHGTFVLMAHSHPNGFPYPSSEDRKVTETVALKLRAVNAQICDHIIFSRNETYYFSKEDRYDANNRFLFGRPLTLDV